VQKPVSVYKMPPKSRFVKTDWPTGSRILTHKGYGVLKSALSQEQDKWIRDTLTVKPEAPPPYDAGLTPFPIYYESKERLYLPRDWAIKTLGEPDKVSLSEGVSLREELKFAGKLRGEQLPIVNSFLGSDANGLICVPCGYGKTFMAIWLAFQLKKRFIIVVHKEFLLAQWQRELESLLPGVRLGRVQGPRLEIGPEYDGAMVMIQTLCLRDFPADTFKDFGFAVFDECHHLGAEHFSKSLIKIQCKHMLGLSATPERTDKLTKVFVWFLGPIIYQIKHRDADESVRAITYRFEAADPEYSKPPFNYKGEVIRARLLNQIAEYKPRTQYLVDRIVPFVVEGRKILILSDRREHLADFEKMLQKAMVTDIGYYVGGMKQEDLDESDKRAVILGTFAMASEAMNIPALNTILLATPKTNIEQSVGRILREKREARKFSPLILDVMDHQHYGCIGQYNHRRNYYKACGYKVYVLEFGQVELKEEEALAKKAAEPVLTECAIMDD
jgi:superfamily II DNA or RNA helicase